MIGHEKVTSDRVLEALEGLLVDVRGMKADLRTVVSRHDELAGEVATIRTSLRSIGLLPNPYMHAQRSSQHTHDQSRTSNGSQTSHLSQSLGSTESTSIAGSSQAGSCFNVGLRKGQLVQAVKPIVVGGTVVAVEGRIGAVTEPTMAGANRVSVRFTERGLSLCVVLGASDIRFVDEAGHGTAPTILNLMDASTIMSPIFSDNSGGSSSAKQNRSGSVYSASHDERVAIYPSVVQVGQDLRTTIMFRNIPDKWSEQTLLTVLRGSVVGLQVDLLYLPSNKMSGRNKGYAFVNCCSYMDVARLHRVLHGRQWPRSDTSKTCEVIYARLQGVVELQKHFAEKRGRKLQPRVDLGGLLAGDERRNVGMSVPPTPASLAVVLDPSPQVQSYENLVSFLPIGQADMRTVSL